MKKSDIEFEKIKLEKGGAKGVTLKFAYFQEIRGSKYLKRPEITNDLPPHDDFIKSFKSLIPIVAKLENLDYARKFQTMQGFEPTDNQLSMIENMVSGIMKTVEITGINISTRKREKGIIISYKKEDINERVTGHATNFISIDPDEFLFDFQDHIKDIVDTIIDEAYSYEFQDKYFDMEQSIIDFLEED